MKRTRIRKISERKLEEKKLEKEETKEMFEFFLKLWDERETEDGECICFETGRGLSRNVYRTNSACYHHVLEKELYPEYRMESWNIIIVLPSIHNQVHTNIDFTPKIKKLKEKYEAEKIV